MPDRSTYEQALMLRINDTIDSYFKKNIHDAVEISGFYEQLWSDMHALISSGGKRLRPRMTLKAYAAFGGEVSDSVVSIATSQELLHMSLLIHDDVIDRDYVRYGVDNIAGKYFKTHYAQVADKASRQHYASSAAILAGDLLISGSYRMIAESGATPRDIAAVLSVHSRSIFDVAGGELIDTEAAFRRMGEVDARTVALHKTASYTFVGPLTIGALLAGAAPEMIEKLSSFAQNLGIAFQLRDDVIGIFGDERTTGKSTVGDIREGKHTYMVEEFYALSTPAQQQRFEKHFGDKDVSDADANEIKDMIVKSGALESAENTIAAYSRMAEKELQGIGVGDMSGLQELISIVTKRDK